jgi:hypothetical protein
MHYIASIKRLQKRNEMKVVCINENWSNLTYGKAYDVIDQTYFDYKIVDDKGYFTWHNIRTVIPMNKWREKQLEELGI